jgi:hypothetical protein
MYWRSNNGTLKTFGKQAIERDQTNKKEEETHCTPFLFQEELAFADRRSLISEYVNLCQT